MNLGIPLKEATSDGCKGHSLAEHQPVFDSMPVMCTSRPIWDSAISFLVPGGGARLCGA